MRHRSGPRRAVRAKKSPTTVGLSVSGNDHTSRRCPVRGLPPRGVGAPSRNPSAQAITSRARQRGCPRPASPDDGKRIARGKDGSGAYRSLTCLGLTFRYAAASRADQRSTSTGTMAMGDWEARRSASAAASCWRALAETSTGLCSFAIVRTSYPLERAFVGILALPRKFADLARAHGTVGEQKLILASGQQGGAEGCWQDRNSLSRRSGNDNQVCKNTGLSRLMVGVALYNAKAHN